MGDLVPGRWVSVKGQVSDAKHHPEDVAVTLASHSEHYTAHVRADRVEPAKPPADLPRCGSMIHVESGSEDYYIRCHKTAGHGKTHRSFGDKWTDDEASGYMEEAS